MDTQVAAWKCAFAFKSAADGAGTKILRNTDRSLQFLRKGTFSCHHRTTGTTWSRSASPQSRKSDSCTRLTHVPRRSSLLLLHCQCSTPAATSSLIGSVKAVRAPAPPDESPADPTARVTVTGLSCLEPYSCLSQAVLTRRAEYPSAPADGFCCDHASQIDGLASSVRECVCLSVLPVSFDRRRAMACFSNRKLKSIT